ncbi:MAG: hypothetical protein NXI21_18180 [Alphaproteobacteria bacterium]|nr:hypothetical protein [Alphaproteobacteria bacterium]
MPVEKSPENARQGESKGRVRWVLIVSLGLAVVALAVVAGLVG